MDIGYGERMIARLKTKGISNGSWSLLPRHRADNCRDAYSSRCVLFNRDLPAPAVARASLSDGELAVKLFEFLHNSRV